MLLRLFHKQIRQLDTLESTRDRKTWPKEWHTVYTKEYPRCESTLLPRQVLPLSNLDSILRSRQTTRSFDKRKPLSIEELSTILFYSTGIKQRPSPQVDEGKQNKDLTKRFYPSGGSRYPIEAYVAVQNVTDVDPGIYHYNVSEHKLEKMLPKEKVQHVFETISYKWALDASIAILLTIVETRNSMKYGNYGYEVMLLETGHLSQNIHLVSESLGKKYCPLTGFDQEKIHSFLDLDEEELVLYMTVLGN